MTDKDIKDIFKNFPDLDKGFEKLKQEVPAMTMDHLRELQEMEERKELLPEPEFTKAKMGSEMEKSVCMYSELEIAAREYSFQDKHFLHNGSVLAVDSLCVCAEDAFMAGANWQKQQDNNDANHALVEQIKTQQMCYEKGMADMKQQMMKEPNLSGYVARDENGNLHIFEVEPRRLEENHRWWDRDYSCYNIDNDAFPDLR